MLGMFFFNWKLVFSNINCINHTTVDGSKIPSNHLGCVKPCKECDKLPTSTGAGFQPSTG